MFMVGSSRLRAVVVPDAPAPAGVGFQVDGVDVCRLKTAPWECLWDAGSVVSARVVRVVASFPDGSRTVATVRTRQMVVSETHVDSVSVSAHVTDRSGRFVTGLA
jgi:hypothetical protein